MKRFIKTSALMTFALALCVLSFFALPFGKSTLTIDFSQISSDSLADMDIAPVTTSQSQRLSGWEPPYDVVEDYVYTGDGRRIFYLKENGMLVTENSKTGEIEVVTTDDTKTTDGSQVLYYNEKSKEFLDGANNVLALFHDSFLDRQYLLDGGRYTRSVKITDSVYKVRMNTTGGGREVYVFITLRPDILWGVFPMGTFTLEISDMNGTVIDPKFFNIPSVPSVWDAVGAAITGNTSAFESLYEFSVKYVLETTTLAELLEYARHATINKNPTIECGQTGLPVVTEDRYLVRVSTRNNQLTDDFGYVLFNKTSGLPIVFHNNDIITLDGKQQKIENAVLKDAFTVLGMLDEGIPFHMHIIETSFGDFNVPTLHIGGDNFTLLNGQSTKGITIDHCPAEVLGEKSLADLINVWLGGLRVFGYDPFGVGGGIINDILQGILLVIIIVLIIIALPTIILIVKKLVGSINDIFLKKPKYKKRRYKK